MDIQWLARQRIHYLYEVCLIVKLSLSHWYPGSRVVLDCIDS